MSGNNSGWNRPASNQPTVKRSSGAPSQWRGVAAGLAIAVPVVALCLWLFSSGEKSQDAASTRERGRIKEVKPAAASKVAEADAPKPKTASVEAADKPVEKPVVAQAEEVAVEKANAKTNKTKRIFKSGLEQVLCHLFTTRVGDNPPPLPRVQVKDVQQLMDIFMSANKVEEGDSERVAEAKASVDYAKKELQAYIKQGGDIDGFLKYYHDELRSAFKMNMDAQRELSKFCESEDDPDIAIAYCKAINKKLDEQGIKHVHMPGKFLEKHNLEEGVEKEGDKEQ